MSWQVVCKVDEIVDKLQQFTVESNGKETKILLAKASDGKFYATSHLCTHYKAPLVKGAYMDDRVVCPWHGACFDIKNGNIEDAPALDALKSYPVKLENGTIYVNVESKPQPAPKKSNIFNNSVVVIVGFGPCALVAAEQLRKQDFKGHIKVVAPELPIDTPKLSKIGTKLPDRSVLQLRDAQHFIDLGIEWINSKVVSVNKSSVVVQDNSMISFDYLVLASGSYARELPFLKGFDNSFTLRTYNCASAINKYLTSGGDEMNIVICGSSFIGLEVAAAFSSTNHKITVVGMESVPLEAVLGPQVGKAIQLLHEKNNIKFELNDTISTVDSNGSTITSVNLKSGKSIKCDMVVAGVGAIPNTLYLENNSLFPINKNKSINTNEFLQVSNNVFAGGDIATYPVNGESTRIEHWNVAQNHGRTIANNIMHLINNEALQPYSNVPYFWTVQFGKSLRYCGHAKPVKTLVQGNINEIINKSEDPSSLKFRAFYADQDGKVGAVASLMWDPVVSHASELFRSNKMPNLNVLEKVDILELPKGMYCINAVGVNGVPNRAYRLAGAFAVFGIAYSISWLLKEK
eukprot:NODE_170_length_16226_cov_0.451169.p1 type:complete len:575 gc:universal NODE_170_length_16226_cov_0.451169:7229-5505(-)